MAKKKRKGERPDGLIQVSLKVGYKPDGRPDRKYFYGHTRAEAERKKEAYKERMMEGLKLDPNITVKTWVDIFLSTYRPRVNKAYLESDAAPYNRLADDIGHVRVVDVTEAMLQKCLNKVDGMSYSTVDKYNQAMKRVFKRAVKNKIIKDNPAEDLIMPNYTKGTHRALDRWEVEHILAHWNNPATHMGRAVLLMLLCGLRRSEMMALRWDDINMTARTLEVKRVAVIHSNQVVIEERAKSDAGIRMLPICQALFEALNSVPEEKRVDWVCLSAKGHQLTQSASSRGLEGFCNVLERILNGEEVDQRGRRTDLKNKKADKAKKETLPEKPRKEFRFTNHDLRHTYATALYDAGVPVKAAQYFLGHADIRMTLELYTHLSKERESASRNQMINYLDEWLDNRVRTALSLELPEDENALKNPDFKG